MAPLLDVDHAAVNGCESGLDTAIQRTHIALEHLLAKSNGQIPEECLPHISNVRFLTASLGSPYFPSPLKQTEAISALKAVEAGVAATIADLAYGIPEGNVNVDMERASSFLFSTYLATLDGMDKFDAGVKPLLPGTFSRHHDAA